MGLALHDLLRDSLSTSSLRKESPKTEEFCNRVDYSLEQKPLRIDESFFRNPRSLSLCEDMQLPFRQWLEFGYEVPAQSAEAIANRRKARGPQRIFFSAISVSPYECQ